MTEFLQHQGSIAYYNENRRGCMWGLFRLLNFHRHSNSRKLLAYRRHENGELGGEIKVPTSRPKNLKRSLDKEVNYQMEEDQASKKSSSNVPMLSSLYKRMTKKRERKMKSSPSTSRLLRTISIHHLECNDYVAYEEMTSESEAELNSQENDSLMVAEAKERGNVFQDRRSVSVNQLQTRQASMEEMELIKSASFPGAGLTGSAEFKGISKDKHKNKVSSLIQDLKSQSAKIISRHKTVEESSQALESDDATVNSSQIDHRRDFDNSINDAIKKDWLRISMDRILHKVPSGHNLPEYIEKERLKLGASGLVYGSAKSENRSMQRSRSLVESLDRYSPLLESISAREPKRAPERLRSLKEDDDNRRVLRSRSLTESAYRNSHLMKSSSVREPRRAIERVVSVRENQVLPERKSMKIFGKVLSNPEILQYPFSKDVQSYESHETASGLLVSKDVDAYVSDGPKLVDSLANTEEGSSAVEPNDSETVDNLERQSEINHEQDQDEACTIPGNSLAEDNYSTSLHEKNEVETEQNDTITEPSPASGLGTDLEEDVVDPEKYEQIEAGPELPPSWIQYEEQECGSNPEDHLGDCCDATEEDEDVEPFKQQLPDLNETRPSHNIQVDEKDENEFNYVSDILRNYSPLEQLVLKDEAIEDGAFDVPDLDRQLMLDVVNEVVFGIYESYAARSTRFTSSDPRIRPVPTGDRVLEEVWAKISWYLASEQYCSSNPLDNVVARDFARGDGWMDLHWDMESVGLEVEDMILDELIDEVLLL